MTEKVYNGETFPDEDARNMFGDFIVAGSGTTSATLCTGLNILVHHPTIQENLQKEVELVVGQNRTISIADRESMPYMCAFIFELLRYVFLIR